MYWYVEVLKKYAVFSGRARRTEYWMFQLVNFFIALAFILILVPLFPSQSDSEKAIGLAVWVVLFCAYILATMIPGVAVSVRRLHDVDLSGWWLLLSLVPLGGLAIFVFHVLDGTSGPNRYGPDPKGRGRAPNAMQYPPYGTQAMANVAGAGVALPGGQPFVGFCTACGTSMQGGTRFCARCGKAAY